MIARQLWHSHQKSWIEEKNLGIGSSELLVRSDFSLVSHGTERTVTTEILDRRTAEVMRVPHMSGSFEDQFTYGYSVIGQVIEGPHKWLNKTVHVMHPHADTLAIDSSAAYVIPDMDRAQAALASNMETAINALWDAQISPGDRVLIVGYGLIGALVAHLIQPIPGCEVIVADINSNRISLSEAHGFQSYTPEMMATFDHAFHTSASSKGLQFSIDNICSNGKVIELSWYGAKKVELKLGDDFHYGRKQVISSQVSQIPPSKQPNWDAKRRKDMVFRVLTTYDFGHLIDSEIKFDDSPIFFESLRKNQIDQISTLIRY